MVREHLRSWLRHTFTGCSFAAHLAAGDKSEPRIGYFVALGPIVQATLDAIEATIDSSAAVGKVAVSIFPEVHTPDATAKMLAMLSRRGRWTITRRTPPAGVRPRGTALSLDWCGQPASAGNSCRWLGRPDRYSSSDDEGRTPQDDAANE
jgi:hypothetical protein